MHTVSILGSIPIANTIVGTGGSVSLLLGDKDIGMELVTQVSIIWLWLKWLATAMVLEEEWSPDHIELWHCTRVGWYKAQDPIYQALNWKAPNVKSCHFNAHQGGMKGASQTASCLTQMDTQAITAGCSNIHIKFQTAQKVDGGKKGKRSANNHDQ